MSLKILILGINGFIGSTLAEHILTKKNWQVYGLDLASDKINHLLPHKNLHFFEGDLTIHHDWIQYHIKKCDVVLPLVAIANPAIYVQDPLRVFELDFEANLNVVRWCVQYGKRIIFPSTSEVYGMCPDTAFDEETSSLVLGPINKPRWIYSCSKQLMDRIIHAYGQKNNLPYTLFRPFNWMGPKLDNILGIKEGGSRAFSQMIGNILRGKDILLVNGGTQRRSFTYIDDGIDALLRIIENHEGCANNRIFNIGNPANDIAIKDLAELLIAAIKTYPDYAANASKTRLVPISAEDYFGAGYQDVGLRMPAIHQAKKYLGWEPTTDLKTAIQKTLDYYLLAGLVVTE